MRSAWTVALIVVVGATTACTASSVIWEHEECFDFAAGESAWTLAIPDECDFILLASEDGLHFEGLATGLEFAPQALLPDAIRPRLDPGFVAEAIVRILHQGAVFALDVDSEDGMYNWTSAGPPIWPCSGDLGVPSRFRGVRSQH